MERTIEAGREINAVIHKGESQDSKGKISEIMSVIQTMPAPPRRIQESSILFKACFTLYNSFILGVMCAVVYFFFSSSFFSFEQVAFLQEARSALFGSISIIIGCVFILLKGRDLNNWFVAQIWKNAASFQLATNSIVMLIAGAGFFLYGSMMFISGIF